MYGILAAGWILEECDMGFDDTFRMSAHAVITDKEGRVLMLKATYGNFSWSFPGGALDPGETVHEALRRECMEELGCSVKVLYLSGIYHHPRVNSHALIFRCELMENAGIVLSEEHSDWKYMPIEEMSDSQKTRVEDCVAFSGDVVSRAFS